MKPSSLLPLKLAIPTVVIALPLWAAHEEPMRLEQAESFAAWVEHVWQRPPFAKGFVQTFLKPQRSAQSAPVDTEVHVALLPNGFGFAIRCLESNPGKLAARYGPQQRDYSLIPSRDDCVEVLIDANRDGETAFGILVTPKGAVVDAVYYPRGYVDSAWDSGVDPRVTILDDAWTVVMEVPFDALGMKLSRGDTIGLALDRSRPASGRQKVSAWPRPKAYWTWRQRRSIPDPFFYAAVVLGAEREGLSFVSTTRGARAPRGRPQENSFAGVVHNRGARPRQFRFDAIQVIGKRSDTFFSTGGVLGPDERRPIHCLYPAAAGGLRFRAVDESSGQVIYDSSTVRTFDIPPRIHDLRGSFDEGLVARRPDAPSKDGYFICPLHLDKKLNVWIAQAHAYETSLEDLVRQMAEHKELPYSTIRDDADYNNLDKKADIFRKHGVKVVFYADWFRFPGPGGFPQAGYLVNVSKNPDSTRRWDYKILPCEEAKRAYFRSLEEGFSRYRDLIWGVVMTDELNQFFLKGIKAAYSDPETRTKYPLVMCTHEDVRQRFGFGKYGLVGSDTPKDDVPYCQIATKRWLNDWVAQLNTEVAQRVKELKPGTYVLSDDPQGQVFPYDYRRRWKDMDIALHQTHDKPMPQDLGTAVITKFVKDTSDVDELWPFVHVEGTSGSYSLDEMREVMSRAFRNGATGISFFNTSWGGSLGRQENVYAPERWDYLNDLAAFYAQGSRAKLPQKAKVAVLYSGYTAMADYSRGIGAVYAYLGPGSGAYFKFIDNFSIERGEIDPAAFDVVFAYHSELEAPAAVGRLLEAVRVAGVTLVITDTEAFSKDPSGRPLRARDDLLGGIVFGPLENRDRKVGRGPDAVGALAAVQGMRVRLPHKIEAPANAKCLLRYEDGGPACVAIALGKGQVIWFGFNPFIGVSALTLDPDAPTGFDYVDQFALDPLVVQTNPTTERFFQLLLSTLGVPLDEQIWKLKLPPPRKRNYWPSGEVCLSGNSVLWSFSRPRTVSNVSMLGRYRYSLPPVQKESAGEDGWIPFSRGRLTDRVAAMREYKSSFDTIATWKTQEPFSVELDLGFRAPINRVEIFATGEIPACQLDGSADGREWTSCGALDATGSTDEIRRLVIPARGHTCRFLRIGVGKRSTDGELRLVEVDVWGRVSASAGN